jgi:GT2 family glycosyltransferase
VKEIPFVSIVVPVRNGERTLRACLTSILRSGFPADRREVVVVDNGSTDSTPEVARSLPVRCVREDRVGLSEARNRGIAESVGEVIVFTDADCVVADTWPGELVAGLAESPEAAVVAGDMVPFPPQTPVERYLARRKPSYLEWSLTHPHAQPWFQFTNAAVRRETFDAVGVFDTRFQGGCEDIDFCWRLIAAGLEVRRRPEAIVLHQNRTTAVQLIRQQLGYGRNHAVLLRKYPGSLAWTAADELAAWRDIVRATREAAAHVRPRTPVDRTELEYLSLDVLRKVAQRLGFLSGLVQGS